MTGALLFALLSALIFATGVSLQHYAVGAQSNVDVAPRTLLTPSQRPYWLIGIALSGLGFGLHAAALRQGSLSIVQPVVLSASVFAVVIRAVLQRRLPTAREISWAACAWAALAVLVSVIPRVETSNIPDGRMAMLFFVAGIAVSEMLVCVAQGMEAATAQGLLLSAAAGVLVGVVGGLTKLLLARTNLGVALFSDWASWGILIAGAGGVLLNQRAYQLARLSVTMPVLSLVDLLVAVGFGSAVFGEPHFASPFGLLGEIGGVVALAMSVWKLARLEEKSIGSAGDRSFVEASLVSSFSAHDES